MSFLDDRQSGSSRDSPPRRSRGPRRPARPGGEVRTRQLVALGVGLLLLLLLVFGVRSCRNSSAERANLGYVQEAGAIVQESRQTSEGLFGLLRDPGDQSPVKLQSTVNGLRVQAEQLADRTARTDHPDDLSGAHTALVETLELRRDGMTGVARELPSALADEGRDAAARRMAEDMRSFLASDVIYARRFVPAVEEQLRAKDLEGRAQVAPSVFLDDIAWLRPETVGERINRLRAPQDARAATPGPHGTGLNGVTATPSGTELNKGGPVEISTGKGVGFDVAVQNQGKSKEDVTVRLTVTPEGGGEPIEVERKLDKPLEAGQSESVSIPLADPPPLDQPVSIGVEVVPVPGEQMKANNKGSFPATFIR